MANQTRHQLLYLTYIRMLVLVFLSGALVVSITWFDVVVYLRSLVLTLLIILLITVVTYLRQLIRIPTTQAEWFLHLHIDVAMYAAWLYQIGGASNPLAFLLLIPLIVTATTLPWHFTLIMAITVGLLYTGLLFFHIPLLELASTHRHDLLTYFNVHTLGMWLNFIISVAIIALFVIRMRLDQQRREQEIAEAREQQIRDQQLLSLATLAAGTAHELGTPLGTMQVILNDLRREAHPGSDETALKEDLAILHQQLELCAGRLRQLRERTQPDTATQQPVGDLVQTAIADWQMMRPEVSFKLTLSDQGQPPLVRVTAAIQQALLNILNNAADANPKGIGIDIAWQNDQVILTIADRGPGIPDHVMENLGDSIVTTKDGWGIGLFLSNAALTAQDGRVRLFNRTGGGTLAEITLPILKQPITDKVRQ